MYDGGEVITRLFFVFLSLWRTCRGSLFCFSYVIRGSGSRTILFVFGGTTRVESLAASKEASLLIRRSVEAT